jgi:hypothetical protein
MNKTIYLVSCASEKQDFTCRADELYTSALFTKSVAYAKKHADLWFILSAKYGLVFPEQILNPYDVTLRKKGASERKLWAGRVFEELLPYLSAGDSVVFLAGKAYRQYLIDQIRRIGCRVEVPMEGLGIGKQLQWLSKQLGKGRYEPVR